MISHPFSPSRSSCHGRLDESARILVESAADELTPCQILPRLSSVFRQAQKLFLKLPLFWRFNLSGWTAFLLPAFGVSLATQQDVGRALGLSLAQFPLELVLTLLLRAAYLRIEKPPKFQVTSAAWVISLSLVATLLHVTLLQIVIFFTGWRNPSWTELEEWLLRIIYTWLVYMGWSLLYFGIKAERMARNADRKAAEAREAAQRMELQLLRSQLDPHFLFNALNGIAAEIPPHPNAALAMVRELASYLRYSLDHRHDRLSLLGSEFDALLNYLKIEQARFGPRLQPNFQADVQARARLVPTFLLQPLVENAVKHRGCGDLARWEIGLVARCSGELLTIEATNTGTLAADWEKAPGVGLQTLRRRLALHYPDRHRLTLQALDGVVLARLELKGPPCSV